MIPSQLVVILIRSYSMQTESTLQSIADMTGLSRITVSCALRNVPNDPHNELRLYLLRLLHAP